MSDNIKKDINNATDARDNNINELRKKIEKISNWLEDKGYINSEEYDSAKNRLEEFLGKFEDNKFLDDLVDVDKLKNLNMINEVISNAINDAQEALSRTTYYNTESQIKDIMNRLINLSTYIRDEYYRIDYLKILGINNLVLIGANGSGKSAFASFMKESMSDQIIVLPAQKILFFNTDSYSFLQNTTRDDYSEIQDKDFNEKNIFRKNNSFKSTIEILKDVFTKTVTLTINEHLNKLLADDNRESLDNYPEVTNYKRFENLWKKLIPSITWHIDGTDKQIKPKKNGNMYSINAMSDGEKAIIFYTLSVLNAKSDSYIIIDEPETYLNPATYKNMWNMLEEARPDCTFIYISHNIDFIESRYFHDLYWIRDYDGNKEWDFKKVDEKAFDLPKNMLTELLGANLPIIFCEGVNGGIDYLVYSALFDNKAIIKPVGGCEEVIKFTDSYKNIPNNTNKAYGLIDKDQKNKKATKKLKEKDVYTLFFNEIEMLLICEPILRAVLISEREVNVDKKIERFKEKISSLTKRSKQIILKLKGKSLADSVLSNKRSNKLDNENDILNDILKVITDDIRALNIDDKVKDLSEKIDLYCNENNYEELLKIIPFKKFLNLANKGISTNYKEKAIQCLKENPELRKELLSNYFSDLEKKIFKEDSKDEETTSEIKS